MVDRRYVSPRILFSLVWISVIIGSLIGPKTLLYQKYGGEISIFLPKGMIWFILAVTSFFIGTLIADKYQLRFRQNPFNLNGDTRYLNPYPLVVLTTTIIILHLLFWLWLTVNEIGSFQGFIELMRENWHLNRKIWFRQKPFPGGILLYTGLIACTIYSFGKVGEISNNWTATSLRVKTKVCALLVLALTPLVLLPLVVSQRIILATALFGGGISFVITKRDGIRMSLVVAIFVLAFGVWTAQEVIRTGQSGLFSALIHSVNLLFHYFQVSLSNITRGVVYMTESSYGLLSFSFVLEFLFTKDVVYSTFLQDFISQTHAVKATGTWNSLIGPFLDYSWFGSVVLVIWGYLSQLSYRYSTKSSLGAQMYGLLGATILVSFHQQFWSNPVFWFNLGLLYMFHRWWIFPKLLQSDTAGKAKTHHSFSRETEEK